MEKEVTKTKKREKIVIYNTDGTTEEYKTGILFTLDEINFIYYDIGHFIDQDVTYNSYDSALIQGGKYGCYRIHQSDE